jgi:hypothetical protein
MMQVIRGRAKGTVRIKQSPAGEDLNDPPPRLDKLRTFARNIHTGVEVGTSLQVKTFDGNNPPPLKPGRAYPQTLDEVNLDDYLITPQTNIEMFLVSRFTILSPLSNWIKIPVGAPLPGYYRGGRSENRGSQPLL